jgi:UDP-N-acetyl-2-amino-2-deoxyglucuronate dehydrogenase
MLRVGILGCGGIARAHAGAYGQFPDRCRVVAVADIFAEKARELAAAIGPEVSACSPDELLARTDVDLVSVCTPPFEHAPLTVAALEAGKHVLVEKPMAISLQECDAMLAAARRRRRALAVVHQNRFRPEFARLKALVDRGILGPLDLLAVNCLWWRGPQYYKLWWRGSWEKEGGGALLNHAVHFVDLLIWLGGMPEEVCAHVATRAHAIEVEDLATAVLRWPGGALGQFTGTVDAHLNEDRVEVCGRRAAVAVPWKVRAFADRGDGFGVEDPEARAAVERLAAEVPISPHRGHAAQIDLVLGALERGEVPSVPGEEGRRAVELITAMYASAAAGRAQALPLGVDHPCYTAEGLRAAMRRWREASARAEGHPQPVCDGS